MTIPEYPHFETVKSLAKQLETSREGLSQAAAETNLSFYGLNEIKEKQHNLFKLFLAQFASPLVYVLVVAALLSLFLGNIHEGLLILLIILINSSIGFWQEVKALASIKALRKLTESRTQVKRENRAFTISSAVPEGLPIVVTLVLTIGAMTLSAKKVYIRHLPSVETLVPLTLSTPNFNEKKKVQV